MAKRTCATAVLAMLLLGVSACGGDGQAAPEPQAESTAPSPSETASESPTPSPSPTPTLEPLSRFEDEPPVIAARDWGVASAKAINREEPTWETAAPYMTKQGRARFPDLAREDYGLYYPGPQPFTPTKVTVTGRTAVIDLCWWGQGWAQDPATDLPARKRSIFPAELIMKKRDGKWLVHNIDFGYGSCKEIPVKGIGW